MALKKASRKHGRNQLARQAQFRTRAGRHGGGKREQARRGRHRARLEERLAKRLAERPERDEAA